MQNQRYGCDLVLYRFSRYQLERGDFDHFLSLYAPDNLPAGGGLREMMNRCVVCIDDWGGPAGRTVMVPEIRRFYSMLHDAWPYWLYFCNLNRDALRAITTCCLPTIETMQVDGQTHVAVTCKLVELLNLLKRDLVAMNLMCGREEVPEKRLYARTMAVLKYFGLPLKVDADKADGPTARL